MSRCKCGKKLNELELKYKEPLTGEYLDYCFDCIEGAYDPETDPLLEEGILESGNTEEDLEQEEYLESIEKLGNKA